jgi:hypothetical protein
MLVLARGERSQAAVSDGMAMASNVVWSWEHGRRAPSTARLFACLWACDIDVRAALERFFAPARPAWLRHLQARRPFPTAALVEHIKGAETTAAFAARVGFDRFVTARWLGNATEPAFPKLLQLVDRGLSRLPDFVDAFVPATKLDELAELLRRTRLLRELAYDHPESEAVLRVVERGGARREGLAAQLPGLDGRKVARALTKLLEAGVVRRDARGQLELAYSLSVHTGRDERRAAELRKFWGHTLVDAAASADDVRSYVIFQASDRELDTLRREVRDFYAALRRRIRTFEGLDHVVGVSVVAAQLTRR